MLNSWYNKIAGSPPPTSFMCLPNDLILKIMASLPSNDVARMACVCSRLRCLASDDDLWKHMFLERFGNMERLHGEGTSGDDLWKHFLEMFGNMERLHGEGTSC